MAQSARQYFEKMFRDAGMDETTLTAALSALSHEKVASNADHLVKTATEDYNAQVGRVRALETQMQQYKDWYGTANTEYQQMQNELAALKAGTQSSAPAGFDPNLYMAKDDVTKLVTTVLNEQGQRNAQVMKLTGRLASHHAATYKEALDFDAVDKIAMEKNIPLDMAYQEYIRPRQEATTAADYEAKLKAAKEEGAREALSRHKLPVDPTPGDAAPIWARRAGTEGSADIDATLMDTWNQAGRTS